MIKLRQPIGNTAARVIRFLLGKGPTYGLAIGRALDLPRGGIYTTLARMARKDLIFRDADSSYSATPYGARELVTYDKVRASLDARR